MLFFLFFFFSSRRRHTRYIGDWSSDVCSSDLARYTQTEGTCRLSRKFPPFGCTGRRPSARDWSHDPNGLGGRIRREIGRASCREREYVSMGTGAEYEKEQTDSEGRDDLTIERR